MATVGANYPTLVDVTKSKDPNGAVAKVVEALSKMNPLIGDAYWQEGNLPTGHRFVSRTGLPSIGWRKYYGGVAPSKSTKSQVDETCGLVEGNSVVDRALARLGGDEAALRASEDIGFVQAMNNEIETGAFYHSTKTNPEKFMGLAPRLNATTDPGGKQIILADASASGGDQTSIWLISWGPDTVFMMYPKGTTGGLQPTNMGEQLWDDGSNTNKKFIALVTNWAWNVGLCVKDWRYLVRIANVDTGNLSATVDTIIPAMIKAYHQLQDTKTGRLAWYCNRTVSTYLHLQALNNTKQSTLKIENIGGMPIVTFLGIPVNISDALTSTEATIS